MTASISDRMIEALTAIATGLHDIADAVRETGQFPGRVDRTQSTETAQKLDDRIPVFEDEYDDARQAVAHWLDRNYGPSLGHAVHDWLAAADDVLEVARASMPLIVTETGPGATQADSAGRGASGGLGERLGALVAEPDPEESQYESVDVAALVGLADEAHRLEVHARVVEQSLRTARLEGDGARIKGEQWKARYEEARDANRRVLQVAQWFRGQGQTGYARKVEEAVGGMEGALNADHPLGKVIGVIREYGTEHYKTEGA